MIIVESACPEPEKKYYVDCNSTLILTNAMQIGTQYGMNWLNLTTDVYITSVSIPGNALTSLLGVVTNLLSCPPTTIPAPITQAIIVYTRPMQQRVIQKCQTQSVKLSFEILWFLQIIAIDLYEIFILINLSTI